jgi:GxxExxY protein
MDENRITQRLIGAAIEVHRILGPGLLETTYQRCLAPELGLRSIPFRREMPVGLNYKGLGIGRAYRIDFLVAERLVVELKAVERVMPVHRAQLLTYLKWSGMRLGLLINFNVPVLKAGIVRMIHDL